MDNVKDKLDKIELNIEVPADDNNKNLQKLQEDKWGTFLNNKTFLTIKNNFVNIKNLLHNFISNIENYITKTDTKINSIENDINNIKTSGIGVKEEQLKNYVNKKEENTLEKNLNIKSMSIDNDNVLVKDNETIIVGNNSKNINIVGSGEKLFYNGKEISSSGNNGEGINEEILAGEVKMRLHPRIFYGYNVGGITTGYNFKNDNFFKTYYTINKNDFVTNTRKLSSDIFYISTPLPTKNKGFIISNFVADNEYERSCNVYSLSTKEINMLFYKMMDCYNQIKVDTTEITHINCPENLFGVVFDLEISIRNNVNPSDIICNLAYKNIEYTFSPLKNGIFYNPYRKIFNVKETDYFGYEKKLVNINNEVANNSKVKIVFFNNYDITNNIHGATINIHDYDNSIKNKLENVNSISIVIELSNIKHFYRSRVKDNWDLLFYEDGSTLYYDGYFKYLEKLNKTSNIKYS